MKRKSPIQHRVAGHFRSGFRVRSYIRGKGATYTVIHKKVIEDFSKSHEPRQYTVTFKYLDKKQEDVKVIATCPKKAILQADALRQRKDQRPVEVVARNVVGEIVGKVAGWAVGGAKEAYRSYKEVREAQKEHELSELEKKVEYEEHKAALERRLRRVKR